MPNSKPLSLSTAQARKLALVSQQLPGTKRSGTALAQSVSTLEHLGYLQIDTISVVQRAHHHVMWSRNSRYQLSHLNQMVKNGDAFEYWAHAASYLPMRDFRFSLPRKHALKTDKQRHWFAKDLKLMDEVYRRIESEGPLMAKDFESATRKLGVWGSKPTKQALENLYMQGDLMTCERRNFHKVYDLTERVLPETVDTSMPTEVEHTDYLIDNVLRAHGFANDAQMTYLLKGVKPQVRQRLAERCEGGSLQQIEVGQQHYYTQAEYLERLEQKLQRKRAVILSPFDNLLIQRERTIKLFGFDYKLECYVPAKDRVHGYFVLPILWDGRLVARIDCKAHRARGELEVIRLILEPSLKRVDEFMDALEQELERFAVFNECDRVMFS